MKSTKPQSSTAAFLVHCLLNATRTGTNVVGNQPFVGPTPVRFYMEVVPESNGLYTIHFGSNTPYCDALQFQTLMDVPRISLPKRRSLNSLYIVSVDLDYMLEDAFFLNPPVRIGDRLDIGQVGASDYARKGKLCHDCKEIYMRH